MILFGCQKLIVQLNCPNLEFINHRLKIKLLFSSHLDNCLAQFLLTFQILFLQVFRTLDFLDKYYLLQQSLRFTFTLIQCFDRWIQSKGQEQITIQVNFHHLIQCNLFHLVLLLSLFIDLNDGYGHLNHLCLHL